MEINHRSLFDTKLIEEHYSKKDGVSVDYVCTSAIGSEAQAMDIFYRETPHPNFNNHYFGLYKNLNDILMITNADKIEETSFDMIEVNGVYYYSRHRHDFFTIGNISIDGGRAYTKLLSDNPLNVKMKSFVIRNGKFFEK